MIEALNLAYSTFEKYNISVTSLIVITIILALAFLFAVREAASWFFKIDAVKKDVRELRRTVQQLEEQIRTLASLVERTRQNVPEVEKKTAPLSGAVNTVSGKENPANQFPIVH